VLYSIGYGNLPVAELDRIAAGLNATILDVRGVPKSRQAGYGRLQLASRFGDRMIWRGDVLGNRGGNTTTAAGLASLRVYDNEDGPHGILVCMCPAPGKCHRHVLIASKLRFDVFHVFQGEVVRSSELSRMMRDQQRNPDARYDWTPLDLYLSPQDETP
jgi:hypothetical protein